VSNPETADREPIGDVFNRAQGKPVTIFIRLQVLKKGKKNPGDDLLSRLCGSIIGSAGLNYWVRNGTRCDPRDIIARKPFRCNFFQLLWSVAADSHFPEEKKAG
jgi:hypothetical protein